jgi:hypothetical protein
MKLKYIILALIVIIFGYLLKTQLTCTDYNGNFHYSSVVSSFHLKELIDTENSSVPMDIVRLFHNKITVFFFDIFGRYIQFFDIFYLIKILSLVGLFGLLNFYYLLFSQKIKNKIFNIFGLLILTFPFLEIFQIMKHSFLLKISILILPFQIVSFLGSLFFLKKNKKSFFVIYLVLLVLSAGWIIVFKNDLLSFCTTG